MLKKPTTKKTKSTLAAVLTYSLGAMIIEGVEHLIPFNDPMHRKLSAVGVAGLASLMYDGKGKQYVNAAGTGALISKGMDLGQTALKQIVTVKSDPSQVEEVLYRMGGLKGDYSQAANCGCNSHSPALAMPQRAIRAITYRDDYNQGNTIDVSHTELNAVA